MGLDINAARFLLAEKIRGVRFGKTLTLGRQSLYMSGNQYQTITALAGGKVTDPSTTEDYMNALGAEPLLAMDFSDYEGAHIIHDANEPISHQLKNMFDTVIDGGTLEHIFNFPVGIRNCMELIKEGGHVILLTPWHNYSGHGFYEFSPELLWNVFSIDNGFEIERMMLVADGFWYEVKNPATIKHRIEIRTNDEVLLFVTAKKIKTTEIFARWPQQSDYETAWKDGSYSLNPSYEPSAIKAYLMKVFPYLTKLQAIRRNRRRFQSLRPSNNVGLKKLCPAHLIPLMASKTSNL